MWGFPTGCKARLRRGFGGSVGRGRRQRARVLRYRWLTPPAPAAIALVRVPLLPALLDRAPPAEGCARFARLVDPAGAVVDEVVAWRLDDGLDLGCHGGPGMRAAVDACLAAHGCLAAAETPAPADPWSRLAAAAHPAAVAWLLAHPGAEPPFPERHLAAPPLILITGPANAGKSSLLNRLCGRRRALVSEVPGTTRDLVAAEALVHGWRLRLLDSAGLRASDDPLEQAGQALVQAARQRADLVLYLDPPEGGGPGPQPGDLHVLGKCDLRQQSGVRSAESGVRDPESGVAWTALESAGDAAVERLGAALLARLGLPPG